MVLNFAATWDGLGVSSRRAILTMVTEIHSARKYDGTPWANLPTDLRGVLMRLDWEFCLGRILEEVR